MLFFRWRLLFLILSITFAENSFSQTVFYEKELKTSLRLIGHELLLVSGDSSSRVLPIENDSNIYKLNFQNDFALHPDELILIVDSVFKLRSFVEAYVVEVLSCEKNEVVYSYAVGGTEEDNLISCKGRALPIACYTIVFTIKKTALFSQNSELDSIAEPEGSNHFVFVFLILVGVILILVSLFIKRKKKLKNAHLIPLGKFQFDQRKAELIMAEQRTELSAKESDLLLLLHSSLNKTLEREFILQKVWGDEGDYVGRTLDVFVSKLRKKLEADDSIRIQNVRGVGYKLQIDK